MADKQIPNITAAAPLDGTEQLHLVQGGNSRRAQVSDLLALSRPTESLILACSDESTVIAAAAGKLTFRMPYAFSLSSVRASLKSPTSAGTFTIDINESGVSVLSTKLTIDAGEKTSTTAATPAVISDASLADDAEITIDVDNAGDGTAYGLKVTLIGNRV